MSAQVIPRDTVVEVISQRVVTEREESAVQTVVGRVRSVRVSFDAVLLTTRTAVSLSVYTGQRAPSGSCKTLRTPVPLEIQQLPGGGVFEFAASVETAGGSDWIVAIEVTGDPLQTRVLFEARSQ